MGQEEKIREFWQFAIDVAWDQHRRHPELSRGKCLKERSFLHTLLNGSDSDVFAEACQMADSVEDKSAMEVLFPRIFDTAVAGEKRRAADIAGAFEAGRCFRYTLWENNWCYIHIYNSRQPESFLADPEYVAENFRYIMDIAGKKDHCDTIFTVSWLNSLPAFQRFFPEEYLRNMAPSPAGDFGATMGWQGQFINRKGELNKSAAAKFLETGVYPLARVESHCSFAALRAHLKNMGLAN